MTAKRGRRLKSEIESYSAHYHPRATCETSGCVWQAGPSDTARHAAKNHAFFNPGHEVRVVQENVSAYFLPPLDEIPDEVPRPGAP